MTHLDTSFLVDLLRESGRRPAGSATSLLNRLGDEHLQISMHVLCELLAGAELAGRPTVERERVRRLCAGLEVVYPDARFPATYGRLLAALERQGHRIATMDLLIATAAIDAEAPLVTRNARDFSRVPGLEVVSY